MSLLNQVKKGKVRQPLLALVYGVDGVGKSSLGASAPDPIFLGTEKGTANLDVARYPTPTSFKSVLEAIQDLTTNKHDYKTLVIDSLDWLEPLVWEQVCVDNDFKNIEAAGYGKGYVLANQYWIKMIHALGRLREVRSMNVVAIAHSQIKTAKDPSQQAEYDRFQLKLNDKAAALWREFVDVVLFYNFQVYTKTDRNGKTKAFGEGERILYTERRPGFDAKSRFSLPFEIEVAHANPWRSLMDAVDASLADDPAVTARKIEALLAEITDEALKGKVRGYVETSANDPARLSAILQKLELQMRN